LSAVKKHNEKFILDVKLIHLLIWGVPSNNEIHMGDKQLKEKPTQVITIKLKPTQEINH
jgi:hypothetical protein